MSPSPSSAIRILLIHDTQNACEPIANAVRNSGQAVRSHFIASLEELAQVIEEQTWDLMLAKLNTATVDATEAIATLQRDGKDIPVIGLIDQYDADIVASALDIGMMDVIVESAEQHIVQAIKREFTSLKERRSLRLIGASLRESEKRCQLLLESSVDAIAYIHDGMHIFANPCYMEMFGYDDIEELQCTPIMDLVSSKEVNRFREALKGLNDGKLNDFHTEGQHVDGSTFKIQMSFSSASYEGEPCTQIIMRTQAVDSEALQEKLKEIASIDAITGLPNKIHFNEQLAIRYQQVLSQSKRQLIIHVGIANFGHIKSQIAATDVDGLIKELAQILDSAKPEDTLLAHYSDDMFAIAQSSADLATAQADWGKIQERIGDHLFEVHGKTVTVKIVCGFAHIDESCKDANEALVNADQAYNQALKQNLKQCYFDKSDIANLADNSIVARVEHALAHDGLRIQFQPIMSLRGDSQEHYDILLRLKDKDGTDISPDDFLPSIENSDLSGKLDRWVVEHSIAHLAEHRKHGHNTQIMIHLMATSIQDPTFLPWVNSKLKAVKLPGDSICFQISEDVAFSYLKTAKAFSKGLSLLKCQLSINHFGMNENGLSLARHLDISYARIHHSYVDSLLADGQPSEKLSELLSNIHQNDINSIVPKIENAEILATLWELGVNYIQGYYLQAPLDNMGYNFDSEDEEAV